MNSERYVLSFVDWLMALWPKSYYTLWFMKNLICFIIASPFIYGLAKNHFNLPTGLIVILILLVNNALGIINTPSGIEMYSVGSYIAINHKGVEAFKSKRLSYFSLVIVLVLFSTKLMVYNTFFVVAFVFASWYALGIFSFENEMPWWLSITFFTYVFHDIILEMLEKILFVVVGTSPLIALLDYIFIPTVTFVIIAFFACVLKTIKPL